MDVLLVLSTSLVFGMVQTVYGCQPTFQSKYDAYSFNGHHSSLQQRIKLCKLIAVYKWRE
jgi:hypothetical protein